MTSIVDQEVKQFAAQAGDWWNPTGPQAMLHKLNPVRLKYVRDQIDQHWQCDECSRTPLSGRTALDVGCGAGLLAEPLVRLGAQVTGLDASAELIEAAKSHADAAGLSIDYRFGELEALEGLFNLGQATRAARSPHPVDAQCDRVVEAADDYHRGGDRHGPEAHA